ncbi:MAG: M23 family metallopeptidase [Marmoricola sp.]
MSLPHTRRGRRVVAITVLGLACALVTVQGAQANDPLVNKHKRLQSQMRSAQGIFDDASASLTAAQTALNRAQKRLDAANTTLAATRKALAAAVVQDNLMRAQLATAQAQLSAAQAAVAQGKQKVAQQRDAIGYFAAQTFQGGDPQLMQIITLLQSGSSSEIAGRLGVIDSVASKQRWMLAEYRQELADLTAKEQSVAAATAQVAQKQQETAAAVAARQKLETAAQTQQEAVAKLVAERAKAKARAADVLRKDKAKLVALKKQDDSIKAQILARKRRDGNRFWAGGGGMLLRPADGPITSPFGWRFHPIYHYWGLHDGVDIGASCGSPQWAADRGTVISEYYSDVWGNRLYIDLGNINGHNYTVIHNHLSRYAVRVGQHVRRGQVVAYTGTTGWSTGCHLHYTVLRDGVAVNPARYF